MTRRHGAGVERKKNMEAWSYQVCHLKFSRYHLLLEETDFLWIFSCHNQIIYIDTKDDCISTNSACVNCLLTQTSLWTAFPRP